MYMQAHPLMEEYRTNTHTLRKEGSCLYMPTKKRMNSAPPTVSQIIPLWFRTFSAFAFKEQRIENRKSLKNSWQTIFRANSSCYLTKNLANACASPDTNEEKDIISGMLTST